jgi:hypothetical protein
LQTKELKHTNRAKELKTNTNRNKNKNRQMKEKGTIQI